MFLKAWNCLTNFEQVFHQLKQCRPNWLVFGIFQKCFKFPSVPSHAALHFAGKKAETKDSGIGRLVGQLITTIVNQAKSASTPRNTPGLANSLMTEAAASTFLDHLNLLHVLLLSRGCLPACVILCNVINLNDYSIGYISFGGGTGHRVGEQAQVTASTSTSSSSGKLDRSV